MESPEKQVRVTIPLLKARMTDINVMGFTLIFGAEYGSPTRISVQMPTERLDLRDGDILTLYTEVLLAKPN